jgi:putative addiction module CopG family antidote
VIVAQTIPQELKHFVANQVASGKYRSEEEVIAVALRLLQERERKFKALQEDLKIGIEQLDQGLGIVVADDTANHGFFKDIENRGQQRLAAKGIGQ